MAWQSLIHEGFALLRYSPEEGQFPSTYAAYPRASVGSVLNGAAIDKAVSTR